MIKHVSSNNILSNYNPIISLKPKVKEIVNQKFFQPIAEFFFGEAINSFDILAVDKLKTEIEFNKDKNFVNEYIYKEIITEISKNEQGEVQFKPKYVFTFDKDLTPFEHNHLKYPYEYIFNKYSLSFSMDKQKILYGTMVLGEEPILYYLWFDIQILLKFIKTINIAYEEILSPKFTVKTSQQVKFAIQNQKNNIDRELSQTRDETRKTLLKEQLLLLKDAEKKPGLALLGKSGNLRVNLSWETIDDLDLQVTDPVGNIISYEKPKAIALDCKGELDIDANAGTGTIDPPPQENISWEEAPAGKYSIKVTLYTKREHLEKVEFTIRVISTNNDQLIYRWYLRNEKDICQVVSFDYNNINGIYNVNKQF